MLDGHAPQYRHIQYAVPSTYRITNRYKATHHTYLTSLVVPLEIHLHISEVSNSLGRGTPSSLQASSTLMDTLGRGQFIWYTYMVTVCIHIIQKLALQHRLNVSTCVQV